MTNLELETLHTEFKNIWMRNKGIPQAMAKWQTKLEAFVNTLEPNKQNMDLLASYMARWQDIMQKNKALLESQKATLQEKLKKGDPTFNQTKNAEKFKTIQ
ncbi:hypothetical protein [Reinekea marinisedimentorum]|uniref:Uncharacterized protein n=1 Tax=Reinekea marinisedimentorum TaxID=230495 RepID=A0A4R3IC60_9GAMM|nr:hypothetical protein [Reinekea marinisedimentorum]TCS42108.1 hypothetical protein BCF53_104213 [Reinekea marinisedimentorum]